MTSRWIIDEPGFRQGTERGAIVAEWAGIATYRSDRSPRLVRADGADEARFLKIAAGAARAIDRRLEGRWSLHASAVGMSGAGVLLLGASGAGKSTMASALVEMGGTLFADDVAFVDDVEGRLCLSPSERQHWLAHGDGPKSAIPAQSCADGAMSLAMAIELTWDATSTRVALEPLRGVAAMEAVSRSVFCLQSGREEAEAHFAAVARLVREVALFRVTRPDRVDPHTVATAIGRARMVLCG